jgi:NADH-quinone oxidoreductase subunit K
MESAQLFSMAAGEWGARLADLAGFRLASCLALAGMVFAVGAWGVLARRNILVVLISVEVMLSAVMLALAAFARAHVNLAVLTGKPYAGESGQVFALFIISLAAAEAAVGLAIVIAYFRNRQTTDTREMKSLSD